MSAFDLDHQTAIEVVKQLRAATNALDSAIRIALDAGSADLTDRPGYLAFRRSAGRVIGEIFWELDKPIAADYPDLYPELDPEISRDA